jgi:SAM-dependent methyltransferase
MKSLISQFLRRATQRIQSIDYWERRYQSGGTSGSGSYNKLATYKSTFINEFIKDHAVKSAIEFGCGDGNQLSLIGYPKYVGLDVSATSIALCAKKFAKDETKSFFLYDPFAFQDRSGVFQCDMSLSLDVIFHILEDDIFNLYMAHLFQSSSRFVVIYSSDYDAPRVNHERRRQFSKWVEQCRPDYRLILRKENPFSKEAAEDDQSFSDFFVYEKKL